MPDITLTGIASAVSTATGIGQMPLPSTGNIGFGQTAQDNNRLPGDGTAIPLGPQLQDVAAIADSFWVWTSEAIDPTRWNKRYPYQLLVLDVNASGVYTIDTSWEFTLPIPPESMSISTPFAINTQITLGGVVEEHNGAPIRMINFRGTTGVMPNRDTAAADLGVPDAQRFTGGVFAGTIQNVVQTAETAALGLGFTQFNLMNETELNVATPGSKGRGTGYYQFRLLQKFLEGYVNMKHNGGAAARRKRLAVAVWKDEAVYVVTPVQFELSRSAQDPLAYSYSLSFKAWKRVKLNGQPPGALENYQGRRHDPSFLQSVLNTIQEARGILAGAKSALEAVRGDIDHVLFEPLRQTALLMKDGLSLATTLAELPDAIARDAATVPTEFSNAASLSQASKTLAQQVQDVNAENQKKIGAQGSTIQRGINGAAPAAKLFANPKDNFELMSQVDVRKLKLKPATRRKIQEEIDRVRRLKRVDFEAMRDQVQQVAQDFAAAIGEGSATFDETYGRPAITATKNPTDEDFDVLFALNNTIIEMSRLAVSGPHESSARVQAIDFVAGLASRSGIAFRIPTSKFAVPYPYGATLEQVAALYLGSPGRWHELVALNGLRAPYVDEEGFEIPLITNGSGNQIVVADSKNLYVGQGVTLFATNASATKRRITSIKVVTPTMAFVNLDGDADLNVFTTTGQAKLHAFLPDTVNSQMMLYIPSTRQVEDELTTKSIPGVNDYTALLAAGGVDLLLTTSGDAAIDDSGDWKLAIGLTNLIQRVRIAFATPKGSLPQHPDFGLGLIAGTSTADMDAKQLLTAAKSMFKDDPDFAGVFSAAVAKKGPAVKLSINVGVAGQDIVIPVSVDVQR